MVKRSLLLSATSLHLLFVFSCLPWVYAFVVTRRTRVIPLPRQPPRPSTVTTKTTRWDRRCLSLPSSSSSSAERETDDDVESSTPRRLVDRESFGRGVTRDFGNRLPEYVSDVRDGLDNTQCLATVFFLFFACLAPAVGFGSVLSAATGGQMGVLETVASTSLSGVLYATLAVQPVQLIGPQGPVVAYLAALYVLATSVLRVPFLPFYAWTGLWTSAFLALLALTNASNLVRRLTRFTDEIFSVLVSALFLLQAVTDISKTFCTAGASAQPLTALLTLTCASVTLGTALVLKQKLPKTNYLTRTWRRQLSDFAPAVGVAVGSLVARAARLHWNTHDAATLTSLTLPSRFVTSTGRSWNISLTALPVWARLWAVGPALLAAVLLYLDQNITARLVNHPRFRQVKGRRRNVTDGMHGDMLVLAGITALTSTWGLPWMCGAPTRSAAHVRALSRVDDEGTVVGTIENRVSGFAIHALIGLCAVAAPARRLLAQVPQAVLSGVFLYLGLTSLQGLELWDRIKGLAKDVPDARFAKVKPRIVSMFTVVQMACVAVMMKVTQSQYGVLSPLLIALLPLVRWGMIKSGMISKDDMQVLDN